jgi:hypothetical protein
VEHQYTAVQESAEEKSLQLTTMLLRTTVVFVLSTLGCVKYVASNLATRLSNERVCFRYLEMVIICCYAIKFDGINKMKRKMKVSQ